MLSTPDLLPAKLQPRNTKDCHPMTTATPQPIWKNVLISIFFSMLMLGSLFWMNALKDYHFSRGHFFGISGFAVVALSPLIYLVWNERSRRSWLLLFALGLFPSFVLLMSLYAQLTRDFNFIPAP